jgi:hypothetical protein
VWSQILGSGSETGPVGFRAIRRRPARCGFIAPLGGSFYSCFSESFASSPIETPRAVAISRTVAQVGLAKPRSITALPEPSVRLPRTRRQRGHNGLEGARRH